MLCLTWQGCYRQATRDNVTLPKVIIVKAAGFEEGEESEGVDALTYATSVGRNVRVVTQALQEIYDQIGIESQIIPFNASEQLESMTRNTTVQVILFAGPSYSSQFPQQLRDVVPKLKDFILDRRIMCTSLTTCRFLGSGGSTVRSFNDELKELGIDTLEGLVIHHEYEDEDWEAKVTDFAREIQKAIEM